MKTTPLRTLLHRPWAVWLAVLIAVLGAIAPTVSHALVLARGTASAGMEVCTNQGPRWIVATDTQTADSDSAPQPGSIFSLAHCPFCLQPTDRVVLINDPLPHPFLVQDGQRKPSVWQVFFYATKHTVNPPPRGPPGFF